MLAAEGARLPPPWACGRPLPTVIVPPVPHQDLEGLLTAKASSWLWIFLPLSNLEDREAQVRHCLLAGSCLPHSQNYSGTGTHPHLPQGADSEPAAHHRPSRTKWPPRRVWGPVESEL